MIFIRQFIIISSILFCLTPVANASNHCTLNEKWSPIEQNIAWTDYVDDPKLVSRIQLLNIWALWCAPCRKELPILAKLNTLPNIDVHLLNMGDEPAQAQAMLEELSVDSLSASVSNNHTLLKDFGAAGIPLTVMFIDGQVAYRYLGIVDDDNDLKEFAQCMTADY